MIDGPSPVRAVPHNSRLQATRVKPRVPEPERYVRMKVLAPLFLAAMSTAVAAGDSSADWGLAYGHWGHAPLYGFDIEVTPKHILVFERSADDPPKGQPCASAYRRVETFETTVSDGPGATSQTYDVFVFELKTVCADGSYLLMAIPRKYRCHARVELYPNINALPSQEERANHARRFIGGRAQYSAGYGLRFPDRVCVPKSQ